MSLIVFVIGVIGGILISLSLVYPLYGYIPSLYGVNWMPIRLDIVIGCIILATVVLMFTGWCAGHWCGLSSRWGPTRAGLVSGLVAALIAYGAIISSSAGILGNENVLLHGLVPEPDEIKFVTLIYDGVIETFKWSAISLWFSIICGALFGGLGGALAKSRSSENMDWKNIFPIISPLMFLISMVIFITTHAALSMLVKIVAEIGQKNKYLNTNNNLSLFFFLIVLVAFLWMIFWQIQLWLDLRSAQKGQRYQYLSWIFASYTSIAAPVLFFILVIWQGMDSYSWLLWPISFYLLVIGFLTFRQTFWQRRHLSRPKIKNPLKQIGLYARGSIILSILLAISNLLGVIQLSLNLVLITVVAINPLMAHDQVSNITLEELIYNKYATSALSTAGTLLLPIIYILFLLWVLKNLMDFLVLYGADVIERLQTIFRSLRIKFGTKRSQ